MSTHYEVHQTPTGWRVDTVVMGVYYCDTAAATADYIRQRGHGQVVKWYPTDAEGRAEVRFVLRTERFLDLVQNLVTIGMLFLAAWLMVRWLAV